MEAFTVTPEIILLLTAVSFVAGFIDSIVGGGGLLTVPALLTAGLPPVLMLGTNKFSATFGSATATFNYVRQRLFDPKLWINGLIAMAIGAALGAYIVQKVSPDFLKKILPAIVFLCGVYFLFSKTLDKKMEKDVVIPKKRQWLQGLGFGFYDGFIGPGVGAFLMVSSLLMYPIDLLRASGLARAMNFVSNFVALTVFIAYGQVAWVLGGCMGLAMMAGAYIGSNSAIKGGAKFIRPIFICIVMAMTANLIRENWFV